MAEVFINTPKVGNAEDAITRDAAIVCSIALQYGAPLETIAWSLTRDSSGAPSGALGEALTALLALDRPSS